MANVQNLRPFRPGRSGNPKGRPPGRGLSMRLRDFLSMCSINGKELPDDKTVGDMIAETLIIMALGGKVSAIQIILMRTEGPPKAGGVHNGTLYEDIDLLRKHLSPQARIKMPPSKRMPKIKRPKIPLPTS
jgi:hypothetical protein